MPGKRKNWSSVLVTCFELVADFSGLRYLKCKRGWWHLLYYREQVRWPGTHEGHWHHAICPLGKQLSHQLSAPQ